MAYVLNSDIVVTDFELQVTITFHFSTNTWAPMVGVMVSKVD